MASKMPKNSSSLASLAAMQFGDGVLRWSATSGRHEFVALNSAGAGITLYKAIGKINPNEFDFEIQSIHTSYPAFSTYDWSPSVPGLIAVGTKEGTVSLLRIDDNSNASIALPLKLGRSCLTVSFNTTGLLAVGLDRIRNDQCLQVWDINQRLSGWDSSKDGWQFSSTSHSIVEQTPLYKMEANVPVTSARFFEDSPQVVVAGIRNTRISIHDLRDPASSVISFQTRNTSNLAIDSRDTNYFASSPLDAPHITIWDRRIGTRSNASKIYCDAVEQSDMSWGCALKLDRAIDTEKNATIKQLRYSRDRRGLLGVLSSTGELQTIQFGKQFIDEDDILIGSPELLQIRKSHILEYPWGHNRFGKPPNTRIDSFDWVRLDDDDHAPRIVYRRFDASLGITVNPSTTEATLFDLLNINSNKMKINHLAMPIFAAISETLNIYGPIAAHQLGHDFGLVESASELTQDIKHPAQTPFGVLESSEMLLQSAETTFDLVSWKHRELAENIEKLRSQLEQTKASPKKEAKDANLQRIYPASRDRRWQHYWESIEAEEFEEYYGALSNIMRRRCVDGYLFDCIKNQKLTSNDPWLQDMWAWIEGAQQAAEQGDMVAEGLDLGYMGVVSVWNNDLGVNPNTRRLETISESQDREWENTTRDIIRRQERANFDGVETTKPHHRQLCLKICGWGKALEELEQDLMRFERKGQFTKAAVWALCERQPQRAIEALERGGGSLVLVALALQVQLSAEKPRAIDTKWETILEQNPELFHDPYLRAVYALISTGDWKLIVREDSMPLRERVGIAIRHLPDSDLTQWLDQELQKAIKAGDIEGIVLAGLGDKMADIMAAYVRISGDFQTAALTLSFTIPHYFEDIRYNQWRAAYRHYQNGHKLHVKRALFDSGHAKLARIRSGKSAIKPPPRQITLRCVHCSTSLPNDMRNTNMAADHLPAPMRAPSSDNRNALLVAGVNGGVCCPACGKHLPRCALCLQTLGLPRSDLQAANRQTTYPSMEGSEEDIQLQREQAQKNFFTFCMKCPHAMHADHALQWFSRHTECPVADCRCQCYAEESARRKDGIVVKEFEKALNDKGKQRAMGSAT